MEATNDNKLETYAPFETVNPFINNLVSNHQIIDLTFAQFLERHENFNANQFSVPLIFWMSLKMNGSNSTMTSLINGIMEIWFYLLRLFVSFFVDFNIFNYIIWLACRCAHTVLLECEGIIKIYNTKLFHCEDECCKFIGSTICYCGTVDPHILLFIEFVMIVRICDMH